MGSRDPFEHDEAAPCRARVARQPQVRGPVRADSVTATTHQKSRGTVQGNGRGKRLAASRGIGPVAPRSPRLARELEIERTWAADREAELAALRVALGLPRSLPERGQGGQP